MPSAASRAICSSCGVSGLLVVGRSVVSRSGTSPAARSSAAARAAKTGGAGGVELAERVPEVFACLDDAAFPSEPLAEEQAGAGEFDRGLAELAGLDGP
ncbi:hypothetical protein [Curtobacterium sp. MCPF17_052]|uniref:hypothetical protein n=1 Tax=Curtobacterium sp. MCPF17_052 TaxID=2175655 RepID=UPI003463FDF0